VYGELVWALSSARKCGAGTTVWHSFRTLMI
jgi:hypothetical protein